MSLLETDSEMAFLILFGQQSEHPEPFIQHWGFSDFFSSSFLFLPTTLLVTKNNDAVMYFWLVFLHQNMLC